jgi:NAD(P)-dependent dehydrogenase (short-subunit alcohol dehydrogenase family)
MALLSTIVFIAIGIVARVIYDYSHPDSITFLQRNTTASTSPTLRLIQAVAMQYQNPICTSDIDLSGQLILLTGGNSGIGFETAKYLVLHGADVVMVARNREKSQQAIEIINKNKVSSGKGDKGSIVYFPVDLSDMDSVINLTDELKSVFPSRTFDQLIQNSAVWPTQYSTSQQGHEITFATNVLGPHLLFRRMMTLKLLKPHAKVLYVTGDIYISLTGTEYANSTHDFVYPNSSKYMEIAYSRSKLGLNWLFHEIVDKYPSYHFNLIHPGVIFTDLAGATDIKLLKYILLNNAQGAQTTLICATSTGSDGLVNGAYYHNALGQILYSTDDIANSKSNSLYIWNLVESLISPYV